MQQAFALIDQNNFMFYSLAATILVLVILISLAIYLDMLCAPVRAKVSPIRGYFYKTTDNPNTLCGIIKHIAVNTVISIYGGNDIGKNIPYKILYRKCG